MLAYQWHGETGIPVVFLHGLLGSRQDWATTLAHLQNFPQIRPLVIDLPLHGKSRHIDCHAFSDARLALHRTFSALLNQPFLLVGYSLGGRLALDYALNVDTPYLRHCVLEGANIGLADEQERQARRANDAAWALRFRHEPIARVLAAWYRQPVFADLDDDKRLDLIRKRQKNDGAAIARMLEATSLAAQPFYGGQPLENMTFFVGERDRKFRQMVDRYRLNYRVIDEAGHNTHFENPRLFAEALFNLIKEKW